MKTLVVLILIVATFTGCAANVATDSSDPAAPLSCELIASSETEQVFKFSDPDIAAPVGTDCVSLGGGVFDCKPDACLVLPYVGTCPHCGGGGE